MLLCVVICDICDIITIGDKMAKKKDYEYQIENVRMGDNSIVSDNSIGGSKKNSGSATKFLSQEEVKEYNDKILNSVLTQGGLMLGPLEEVEMRIANYFELCERTNQLPSVKALALYLGVTYQKFLSYANNPVSPYFNMLNMARDMCHVVIENGAMNNAVNPATYMFTASNYYGMKNTQSVSIANPSKQEVDLGSSDEVINALRGVINSVGSAGSSSEIKDAKVVSEREA